VLAVVCTAALPVSADIYEWEYIDPLQPELGKQQSTTVAPGGAGVDAVPGVNLFYRDLTKAYLIGADLTDASLDHAVLADADLTNAIITGAYLKNITPYGFTAPQLYSTASYQAGDLSAVKFYGNEMRGWDFVGQNLNGADFFLADLTDAVFTNADLTSANLGRAILTNVDFTGAIVADTNFSEGTRNGFTFQKLQSTASFQAGNLRGIGLGGNNDLAGWDLSNQDLTGASFLEVRSLAGTQFDGAVINDVTLTAATYAGFTEQQLMSTASYQNNDLQGVRLSSNDLSGWDFSGQNLSNANFNSARLAGADFTGAMITGALFRNAINKGLAFEQLQSTADYQAGGLTYVDLSSNDLSGWDLSGLNLTGALFTNANLSGADLSGANLYQAYLGSTTVFLDANLSGAVLEQANFISARLLNTDMRDAVFTDASLENARMTGADARGSTGLTDAQVDEATWVRGLIRSDGTMREGLVPAPNESIWVRDDDGNASRSPIPITVQNAFDIDPAATLRILFEDIDWGSTIHFDPSVGTAYFGGTLELTMKLDEGLTPADLLGATFQLFDWTGVTIDGGFDDIVLDAAWFAAGLSIDLSQFMTTGDVRVVPLIGDLDGDGFVGITDLNVILSRWNQPVPPGSLPSGDLSGDGFVGIEDLNAVLGTWNDSVPPPGIGSSVPEPGGAVLLGIGVAVTAGRRRII
jgi:uncharacterized protein YjbI with pentapeptide repeats